MYETSEQKWKNKSVKIFQVTSELLHYFDKLDQFG